MTGQTASANPGSDPMLTTLNVLNEVKAAVGGNHSEQSLKKAIQRVLTNLSEADPPKISARRPGRGGNWLLTSKDAKLVIDEVISMYRDEADLDRARGVFDMLHISGDPDSAFSTRQLEILRNWDGGERSQASGAEAHVALPDSGDADDGTARSIEPTHEADDDVRGILARAFDLPFLYAWDLGEHARKPAEFACLLGNETLNAPVLQLALAINAKLQLLLGHLMGKQFDDHEYISDYLDIVFFQGIDTETPLVIAGKDIFVYLFEKSEKLAKLGSYLLPLPSERPTSGTCDEPDSGRSPTPRIQASKLRKSVNDMNEYLDKAVVTLKESLKNISEGLGKLEQSLSDR